MQLKKAINGYLKHIAIYGSSGYYAFSKEQAKAILKYFDEYDELESMNFKIVYQYIEFSKSQGLKNNTINKRIAFLRRLARFNDVNNDLVHLKQLRVNFITYGRISNNDLARIDKVMAGFPLKDRLVYQAFKDTGVRVNELLNIKAHYVDLSQNNITLEITKTGKGRQVFFTDKTKSLLQKYIKENATRLSDKNAILFDIGRERINLLFKKIKLKSGIDRISPHRLRHTLASELYGNGCDLLYISKLLGHCNLETTKNYILVNEQKAFEIYKKYMGGNSGSERTKKAI